jgi:hypothetical protein
MKRHIFAFLIIGLCSEVITTWVQGNRTVSDVYPGLYYPSFRVLMLERLLVWSVVFLVLTAVWAFVNKTMKN